MKLLVMSNFTFSHSVFKRLVLQTHKNQDLFGKGLTQFSRLVQLYRDSLSMFSWNYFHQYLHNILFKPLAAFPHNFCRNNGQWWERDELCRNDISSILGKNIDRTSDLLFSSPVRFWLSYWARLWQNKQMIKISDQPAHSLQSDLDQCCLQKNLF